MYKRNFAAAIRKTPIWKLRVIEPGAFEYREDMPIEDMDKIMIHGNSAMSTDGRILSVGDFDEESGKYIVTLHSYGNRIMDGHMLAEIIRKKFGSEFISIADDGSTATFLFTADMNGMKVIGSEDLGTLTTRNMTAAIYVRNHNAGTYAYTNMQIVSPEGDKITDLHAPIRDSEGSFRKYTSMLKTVGSIIVNAKGKVPITIDCEKLGFYRGVIHDYEEEEYIGKKARIALSEPLRLVGGIYDELDLASGEVIRRSAEVTLDGSTEFEMTDDGLFRIPLVIPAADDSPILSNLMEKRSVSELLAGEVGIAVEEGAKSLLMRADASISSPEELEEYLLANPIDVNYVRRDASEESYKITIPYEEGHFNLDVLAKVGPLRCFFETVLKKVEE